MSAPRLKIVQPLPDNGAPLNARLAASMLGTMLYPNEAQAHERLATSYALLMHWLSKYTGDPAADAQKWGSEKLATRLEVIQMMRFVELSSLDELRKRWRQGVVAGDVVRMLNWLYRHDPKLASMKRARFMVSQLHTYHTRVSGRPTALSESSIKSCWKEFRCVSHWWAGIGEKLKLLQTLGKAEGWENEQVNERMFSNLMSDPSDLIGYGINHLKVVDFLSKPTKQAPTGILNWDECWHVPYQFVPAETPAFMDPQKLYEGLAPWAEDVLAKYEHE